MVFLRHMNFDIFGKYLLEFYIVIWSYIPMRK
jgi:hypothetical protein